MSLETTCRACGQPFTASTADVRAGTWRDCPDCRAATPAAPNPAPSTERIVIAAERTHRVSAAGGNRP